MTGGSIAAPGFWRNADESIQQFLYPKIIDRTTKENRCFDAAQVGFIVKIAINPINQRGIIPELICIFLTHQVIQQRIIEVINLYTVFCRCFLVGIEEQQTFIV